MYHFFVKPCFQQAGCNAKFLWPSKTNVFQASRPPFRSSGFWSFWSWLPWRWWLPWPRCWVPWWPWPWVNVWWYLYVRKFAKMTPTRITRRSNNDVVQGHRIHGILDCILMTWTDGLCAFLQILPARPCTTLCVYDWQLFGQFPRRNTLRWIRCTKNYSGLLLPHRSSCGHFADCPITLMSCLCFCEECCLFALTQQKIGLVGWWLCSVGWLFVCLSTCAVGLS